MGQREISKSVFQSAVLFLKVWNKIYQTTCFFVCFFFLEFSDFLAIFLTQVNLI